MRIIAYLSVICIALVGCFPEDDIIDREKIPEGIKIGNVELTSNYRYQVYFDLETNRALKSNHIKDWDLGFDCSDTAFRIILNSALMGEVFISKDTGFVNVTEIPSINDKGWKWDAYNGDLGQTAIGEWYRIDNSKIVSRNAVYIYNRGIDENGNNMGYKKFQIIGFENNSYRIRFSEMDNSKMHTALIPKISNRIFHYLSFNGDGTILDLEPDKDIWDILFSRYREQLVTDDGSDTLQYAVVGAYLSRYETGAFKVDSNVNFLDLSDNELSTYQLSNDINTIGHEWKVYDIDLSIYTMVPNRYYFIETSLDRIYKLRFLSYFNDLGERGHPEFEYQRLK